LVDFPVNFIKQFVSGFVEYIPQWAV